MILCDVNARPARAGLRRRIAVAYPVLWPGDAAKVHAAAEATETRTAGTRAVIRGGTARFPDAGLETRFTRYPPVAECWLLGFQISLTRVKTRQPRPLPRHATC